MKTSWEKSAKDYDKLLGNKGDYFHKELIVPSLLKMLDLTDKSSIIDLACGQGIVSRYISSKINYTGVDISPSLVSAAKYRDHNKTHVYLQADVSEPLKVTQKFTHATCVLAIQNIANHEGVIKNASDLLDKNGVFVIVLNHPIFRIPKQSGWGIEDRSKQQYRWVTKYMSNMKIPITMNPGNRGNKKLTWSFHLPLSEYFKAFKKFGFVVSDLEELVSEKRSFGKTAKMENSSRAEIPMFMIIKAIKL